MQWEKCSDYIGWKILMSIYERNICWIRKNQWIAQDVHNDIHNIQFYDTGV